LAKTVDTRKEQEHSKKSKFRQIYWIIEVFTDNSLTFSKNWPDDFRANNVKNWLNYPENQSLERKNREKYQHDIY
jgi:hypothetical protein